MSQPIQGRAALAIICMIKRRRLQRPGFTLIELLVVLGILLVASSLMRFHSSSGLGTALTASQRIVSGMVQGARGQALLKGVKSRLIIYSDSSRNLDADKKLRYLGIIHEDGETTNHWSAATPGTYLPKGIYFDPQLSESNGWVAATTQIEYPCLQSRSLGDGAEYYHYEFESDGTTAGDFHNAWLVLRAGVLRPDSTGKLEVDWTPEPLQGLKAALILRRVGTTKVNEPNCIDDG